ncbi:MAG: hypothetical protein Harvfovirus35_8 [Harvfovirus sp.]|uniref:Uncharacterized protein n=1 Tax=Harvfovirus sp. TaxID=2487768 RepID=A0A3G5A7M8_9VIRU|nr:MAG: hypothetical protein Harvfovirus35_8 [Harvfovirus sp.]
MNHTQSKCIALFIFIGVIIHGTFICTLSENLFKINHTNAILIIVGNVLILVLCLILEFVIYQHLTDLFPRAGPFFIIFLIINFIYDAICVFSMNQDYFSQPLYVSLYVFTIIEYMIVLPLICKCVFWIFIGSCYRVFSLSRRLNNPDKFYPTYDMIQKIHSQNITTNCQECKQSFSATSKLKISQCTHYVHYECSKETCITCSPV